jgi:ribosome-dependent ATPase
MLVSAFARTQIAALFGTAILTVLPATQFSGMTTPVSSLAGGAQIIGRGFPMTYFVPISVGTFTKGLGLADLAANLGALALFIPVLMLLSVLLLRKQERYGPCARLRISIGSASRNCAVSCTITCCWAW